VNSRSCAGPHSLLVQGREDRLLNDQRQGGIGDEPMHHSVKPLNAAGAWFPAEGFYQWEKLDMKSKQADLYLFCGTVELWIGLDEIGWHRIVFDPK
jgi:hypothetical protein